ncbi:hypothetical protein P168DRAFT_134783 [Aspergillus campestris IBT 28561]|uniref:Uncharacterized protein n=1 Tax=Aspergillus campestris (strain IBT 28561) TaxID=1392248 RepID=A0A2I1D8A0_ASPC2|nr:uncharacterized protein P168DRAFT_134783 [Aspergillus campestris IBT 28561]PKY06100.1 hypothetical protein P168DRAFT_134783 [Aspergillus campestris IBT 28561]
MSTGLVESMWHWFRIGTPTASLPLSLLVYRPSRIIRARVVHDLAIQLPFQPSRAGLLGNSEEVNHSAEDCVKCTAVSSLKPIQNAFHLRVCRLCGDLSVLRVAVASDGAFPAQQHGWSLPRSWSVPVYPSSADTVANALCNRCHGCMPTPKEVLLRWHGADMRRWLQEGRDPLYAFKDRLW